MLNLISAIECKQKSLLALKTKQYAAVQKSITNGVTDGRTRCSVTTSGHMDDILKHELMKLGFEVQYVASHGGQHQYYIDWG